MSSLKTILSLITLIGIRLFIGATVYAVVTQLISNVNTGTINPNTLYTATLDGVPLRIVL